MAVFEYSSDVDVLYIRLSENAVDRTIVIDNGTMVDIDREGRSVGIEIIRPARDWPLTLIQDRVGLPDGDAELIAAYRPANNLFQFTRHLQRA